MHHHYNQPPPPTMKGDHPSPIVLSMEFGRPLLPVGLSELYDTQIFLEDHPPEVPVCPNPISPVLTLPRVSTCPCPDGQLSQHSGLGLCPAVHPMESWCGLSPDTCLCLHAGSCPNVGYYPGLVAPPILVPKPDCSLPFPDFIVRP
jgi:hypothetical protein